MKSVVLYLAVLAGVIVSLSASPSAREERAADASPSLGLSGFLQRAGLVSERSTIARHKRQEEINCTDDTECYPDGIKGVPSSLIECLADGKCFCDECFENAPDGTCQEVSCVDWRYDVNNSRCQDNRPTQVVAFLLSFFLSSTGAANFYIGRDDLGGAQLFLLLLLFAISYFMCYLPCCLACCMDSDNVKGSIGFMCVMVLETILMVLVLLAIWAWWMADLIIFILNQRDAGNGCSLKENF